jgi:hypothetical protein
MCMPAGVATWSFLDASMYDALGTSAPLLFVAGSPSLSSLTLQLATAATPTTPCFYDCCSVPVATVAPPAACAPFQPVWSIAGTVPLGVLAATPTPPSANDANAIVALGPANAVPAGAALTQFALAFGIAGQGPGAQLPVLPDGAEVIVLLETYTAGGSPSMQAFTTRTNTPGSADWNPIINPPGVSSSNISVTLIQTSMSALKTIPFLQCQLSGTCTFTGRATICWWYGSTPNLPPGTSAFTLGVQWAAFGNSAAVLSPALTSALPVQLASSSCSVQQTAAGNIACSAPLAMRAPLAVRAQPLQTRTASPPSSLTTTTRNDLAPLIAASVVAVIVSVLFMVFVPKLALTLRR